MNREKSVLSRMTPKVMHLSVCDNLFLELEFQHIVRTKNMNKTKNVLTKEKKISSKSRIFLGSKIFKK